MARILVAEDFAPVRNFIAETLAQVGYEPIPVADGIAGFHLLQQECFDAVVTSDHMGGGDRDGNRMLINARKAGHPCSGAVMISLGYAKYLVRDDRERCLQILQEEWGVDYLSIIPGRPFTDKILVQEVGCVTKRR